MDMLWKYISSQLALHSRLSVPVPARDWSPTKGAVLPFDRKKDIVVHNTIKPEI
jgi:hypothetical protein